MKFLLLVGSVAVIATVGATDLALAQAKRGAAPPAKAQAATGPIATYWMSAETSTGLGAMAAGMMPGLGSMGGSADREAAPQAEPPRPSARAVIGGLLGGGGGLLGRRGNRQASPQAAPAPRMAEQDPVIRQLLLQLGSRTSPPTPPSAEHLVPPALGVGPMLPLVTPEKAAPVRMDGQFERPKGRVLLYWGCGERARTGQPVTIDFARLAAGQLPPGLGSGPQVRTDTPPSSARFPGYGEWPNQRLRKQLPGTASLVGDHVVRGNYSPEMRFALAQGQDFLGPLRVTNNSADASGAVPVRWQAVPNATAYFAMATGSTADGTLVMWTSSETQLFGMGFYDYLNASEAARLVQGKVLMSPATTQCTVPAEVTRAVQGAALMMTAYGPETNLAQPKPAGAPPSWRPDWTVKLRTRSTNMGMLGMDMGAMLRGR